MGQLHTVKKRATVRHYGHGFLIGTLYPDDQFYTLSRGRREIEGWVWGYGPKPNRGFRGFGWVWRNRLGSHSEHTVSDKKYDDYINSTNNKNTMSFHDRHEARAYFLKHLARLHKGLPSAGSTGPELKVVAKQGVPIITLNGNNYSYSPTRKRWRYGLTQYNAPVYMRRFNPNIDQFRWRYTAQHTGVHAVVYSEKGFKSGDDDEDFTIWGFVDANSVELKPIPPKGTK